MEPLSSDVFSDPGNYGSPTETSTTKLHQFPGDKQPLILHPPTNADKYHDRRKEAATAGFHPAHKWLVILAFCLLCSFSAAMWVTYSAIDDDVGRYYNKSGTDVSLLSIGYMGCSVLGMLPSARMLEVKGLRITLIVGGVLTVIGAGIRIVGTKTNFWLLVAGQCVAGIGAPFLCNAPAKLSLLWFPDSQRVLATTLGAVANPLGVAIGENK